MLVVFQVIKPALIMFKKLFITLLSLLFSTPTQAASAFQSHESIYAAVNDHIAQHINIASEYEISITPLDTLLKLPECAEALETFSPGDLLKAGRNSIGVRCTAANKWSIFTSAVIKIYQPVLVLTQAVQRGELITRQHLALERRDVSRLRDDFVTQVEQIENKQAIRALAQGSVVSARSLADPLLVKRGDKVIISAEQTAFSIKMNGTAMMNGSKGQRIPIKNQNSGRIINATVIEPGLVSVTSTVK